MPGLISVLAIALLLPVTYQIDVCRADPVRLDLHVGDVFGVDHGHHDQPSLRALFDDDGTGRQQADETRQGRERLGPCQPWNR